VLDLLPKFQEMLKQAGRDPASCPLSLSSAPLDLDLFKRARDNGVVRVGVALHAATEAEALPILDQWAELITRL
jgi:hypothetical protein